MKLCSDLKCGIPLLSLNFVGLFSAAPGGTLIHTVNTVPDNEP